MKLLIAVLALASAGPAAASELYVISREKAAAKISIGGGPEKLLAPGASVPFEVELHQAYEVVLVDADGRRHTRKVSPALANSAETPGGGIVWCVVYEKSLNLLGGEDCQNWVDY